MSDASRPAAARRPLLRGLGAWLFGLVFIAALCGFWRLLVGAMPVLLLLFVFLAGGWTIALLIDGLARAADRSPSLHDEDA